jgi:hypothetical protein
MVYSVEELLKVHIYDPVMSGRYMLPSSLKSLMGAFAGTEAVAVAGEGGIEDWGENLKNRLLDKTVQNGWYAQLSHAAVWLGDFHAAYRLREIPAFQQ